MGFRDSFARISPPWLAEDVSSRINYALGVVLDAMSDRVREGVRARMPGVGTPDALPFIGNDRQIDRGPSESATGYAARLTRAFDSWRVAGNARELLAQTRAYFLPSPPPIRIVNDRSVWHSIDPTTGEVTRSIASPPNWTWDDDASSATPTPASPRWWRAWLVIDSSAGPWRQWFYGEPGVTFGSGLTWGSTATEEEVQSIRRVVAKWKPAHAHARVILTFAAGLFEASDAPGSPMPSQDYDAYENRSRDAAYWEGDPT